MSSTNSHVLALKYRPQVFADLIGQEALVRTITNAIDSNRLAHAYMLTGIRGIGKTSSARIIAKGLNCIGPDGNGGMTPAPCGKCKHCLDIANDAHIDVIEIDAASNTGVDNVREIIEGAQYNPVSARFKIYIIDEVHMLSKQAFNALLKTLEEPPERVKFIFATTEIRKVPVTILSRCQRFDLRRIDEQTLSSHLANIVEKEGAKAESDALHLIARAGDGSVRDSLSLLDQAITQFNGDIHVPDVRQMLGLADRTVLFDLYESVMQGNIAESLRLLDVQYNCGADPLVITQDMMELTHWLTKIKIIPTLVDDVTIPEPERVRGKQMAATYSMASLSLVWQMMMKGIAEVRLADNPMKALEMLLIRLAYASELPSPAQIIEDIKKNGLTAETTPVAKPAVAVRMPTAVQPESQDIPQLTSIEPAKQQVSVSTPEDIIKLARNNREMMLAFNVERNIRFDSIQNGQIVCAFTDNAPDRLSADLITFLNKQTGTSWTVKLNENSTAKTGAEVKEEKKNQQLSELKQHPVVSALLQTFKDAKIEKIQMLKTVEVEDSNQSEDMD